MWSELSSNVAQFSWWSGGFLNWSTSVIWTFNDVKHLFAVFEVIWRHAVRNCAVFCEYFQVVYVPSLWSIFLWECCDQHENLYHFRILSKVQLCSGGIAHKFGQPSSAAFRFTLSDILSCFEIFHVWYTLQDFDFGARISLQFLNNFY